MPTEPGAQKAPQKNYVDTKIITAVTAIADKRSPVFFFYPNSLVNKVPYEYSEEASVFIHKLKILFVTAAGVSH